MNRNLPCLCRIALLSVNVHHKAKPILPPAAANMNMKSWRQHVKANMLVAYLLRRLFVKFIAASGGSCTWLLGAGSDPESYWLLLADCWAASLYAVERKRTVSWPILLRHHMRMCVEDVRTFLAPPEKRKQCVFAWIPFRLQYTCPCIQYASLDGASLPSACVCATPSRHSVVYHRRSCSIKKKRTIAWRQWARWQELAEEMTCMLSWFHRWRSPFLLRERSMDLFLQSFL